MLEGQLNWLLPERELNAKGSGSSCGSHFTTTHNDEGGVVEKCSGIRHTHRPCVTNGGKTRHRSSYRRTSAHGQLVSHYTIHVTRVSITCSLRCQKHKVTRHLLISPRRKTQRLYNSSSYDADHENSHVPSRLVSLICIVCLPR